MMIISWSSTHGGKWSCKEWIRFSTTGSLANSTTGGHLSLASHMHSLGTRIASVGCGWSTDVGE